MNADVDVYELLADWGVANYLDDRFGIEFPGDVDVRPSPVSRLDENGKLAKPFTQFAAEYIALPLEPGAYAIDFKGDTTTLLLGGLDETAGSFWHAGSEDSAAYSLTREFDLRSATREDDAALTLLLRHDTEENWDYLYAAASTDDGQNVAGPPLSRNAGHVGDRSRQRDVRRGFHRNKRRRRAAPLDSRRARPLAIHRPKNPVPPPLPDRSIHQPRRRIPCRRMAPRRRLRLDRRRPPHPRPPCRPHHPPRTRWRLDARRLPFHQQPCPTKLRRPPNHTLSRRRTRNHPNAPRPKQPRRPPIQQPRRPNHPRRPHGHAPGPPNPPPPPTQP